MWKFNEPIIEGVEATSKFHRQRTKAREVFRNLRNRSPRHVVDHRLHSQNDIEDSRTRQLLHRPLHAPHLLWNQDQLAGHRRLRFAQLRIVSQKFCQESQRSLTAASHPAWCSGLFLHHGLRNLRIEQSSAVWSSSRFLHVKLKTQFSKFLHQLNLLTTNKKEKQLKL